MKLFLVHSLFLLSLFTGCAGQPTEEKISDNMTSTTTYNPPLYVVEVESIAKTPQPDFMVVNQSRVIKEVQQKLKYLGHTPGSVDGVVGPNTSTALIKFQRANGLAVTGQINEATLNALNLDPTRDSQIFAE